MLNRKLIAALLLLVSISLVTSVINASLISTVLIQNTGQISQGITANSGSAADIQAAVNLLSASGGIVHIPSGTFYWNGEQVTIPGGVSVIGASPAGCKGHEDNWESYNATTILHNNANAATMPTMFYINGGNGKSSRISGIQFEATPPANTAEENAATGNAIATTMLKNFRIDHCSFINFCASATFIDSSSGLSNPIYNSYGVTDHCVIDNPYKLGGSGWVWGYGFYSRGNMKPVHNNWDSDITHFAGQYGAVSATTIMYVEDCHMSRCRHSVDAIQGSWNVVRYCLIDNAYPDWGDICLHGSQSWYGGRGMEVYNNTVNGGTWMQNLGGVRLRGGSALVFNNTVSYAVNSTSQTLIVLDDYDYSMLYPFTNINQTHLWNNVNTNCTSIRVLQGTLNVNYFLRAPNQLQDGFTYMPYQYPHPLTTQP